MTAIDFASDPPLIWEIFGRVAGERAFDVGANGGITSRLLAERFDEVHAFEPAVESFNVLAERLPENVTAHLCAVSDHDGQVTLDERAVLGRMGELTTGDTMVRSWGEQTGTRQVPSVTLDSFAAEHGDPDFVKIDTEGHERAVVEGGLKTLNGGCRLLIEVHAAEHGDWIMTNLDGPLTQVRHPAYIPGTEYFDNHWFLLRGV